MKYQKRYLTQQVINDLKQKMVFIGGPRQVGKTTLVKHLLPKNNKGYLNWDIPEDRKAILQREFPTEKLWIFDELHKYKKWRNYLKGLYDQFGTTHQILVTGSARLDYYRHGGDSLQGRYHYLRLHPLSVAELNLNPKKDLQNLLELGGFPEPFMLSSKVESKRWSHEYRQRLIQEDLLSLEHVKDIGTLELLMLRLPNSVGSPLSINALRQDLQVSHKALSHWLEIFSNLYAIFRIPPFGSPLIRAVKKERKHYHYDWTLINETSFRFENLVACHLLKWVHFMQDTQGRNVELRYFRDTEGREIDFIVTENGEPIQAIECKSNDKDISKHLYYFQKRFPNCQAWQIALNGKKDYLATNKIRVCPAEVFLKTLV